VYAYESRRKQRDQPITDALLAWVEKAPAQLKSPAAERAGCDPSELIRFEPLGLNG